LDVALTLHFTPLTFSVLTPRAHGSSNIRERLSAMPEMKRDVSASLNRHPNILRPSPTDKPAVLVVEDNDDIRFIIRYLLEQRGYRVMEAADGLEPVESAQSFQPDLILMDISLPGLDGIGALSLIRDRVELRATQVVAISCHAAAEDIAAARAAGFDDYLVKPIDINQLDHVLGKNLSAKKSVEFGEAPYRTGGVSR
jgi:CheY-like chemotaxis protein